MQTVHPSPEAIRLAVSRIQRAVETHGSDQEAPMDFGIILRHGCRTTACHAGWYTLGRFMDHSAVRWLHDETFYTDPGETMMALTPDGNVSHLMYHDGAHVLTRDLGFMNAPALKGWAKRHPGIWGGPHGDRMFAGDGAAAFGKPPSAPVMVSEIAAWWLAVADRLDAAIPVHVDRAAARAALKRHDAETQQTISMAISMGTIAIEPCTGGYRLVRRPYPVSLLPLQP